MGPGPGGVLVGVSLFPGSSGEDALAPGDLAGERPQPDARRCLTGVAGEVTGEGVTTGSVRFSHDVVLLLVLNCNWTTGFFTFFFILKIN